MDSDLVSMLDTRQIYFSWYTSDAPGYPSVPEGLHQILCSNGLLPSCNISLRTTRNADHNFQTLPRHTHLDRILLIVISIFDFS